MAQRVKVDNGPLHGLWAITNRELKKWYKNYILLAMSLVQPILWLGLFGKSMNLGSLFTSVSNPALSALGSEIMEHTFGTSSYFSFLAVGMLAFIVLFTSMQSGMSIVWDRRLGFLSKIMTTSVPRGNIIVGKALSSVLKSLAQATIVLIIATLLGLQYRNGVNVLDFLGMYAALFLMSLGLSSIFLMLALRSTSWESQMAIMNLLNMPLLFASNAFYPVSLMPGWLKPVVEVNPISYANDIDRQLLLGSVGMYSIAFDFAFLVAFAAIFTGISMYMSWKYLTK